MNAKAAELSRKEIILTGFGGQGIVLAGRIVGEAASLGDHRESTLTQSYGPEARGGACSAHVIISDGSIHYPYVRHPDILVCMSQGGFDKFGSLLKDDGTLITDQDLVQVGPLKSENCLRHPRHPDGRGTGQEDDGQHRHGGLFYRRHRGAFPWKRRAARSRDRCPAARKS